MPRKRELATAIRILHRTKTRIEDPKHWTKGAFARRGDGDNCSPDDPEAEKWCVLGSLARETKRSQRSGEIARGALFDSTTTRSPANINDQRGHRAVLVLLDRAIVRLTKELEQ